jgi:hypothetical protein
MEIGVLATTLQVDAVELAKAHNLAEDIKEIDDETLAKVLKVEIENVKTKEKASAKKEGHGWGSKETLTNVEKDLANEFGLKAGNFKEMLSELKEVIKTPATDDKTALQIESLKEKVKLTEKSFSDYKLNIEKEKKDSKVNETISKVLGNHFNLTNQKLVTLGLKDFHSTYDVDVDDEGGIQLYGKDKKPVFKPAEDILKSHFGDLLPTKSDDDDGGKVKIPNIDKAKEIKVNGVTVEALTMELHKAKTPEERAAILKKIQDLEK